MGPGKHFMLAAGMLALAGAAAAAPLNFLTSSYDSLDNINDFPPTGADASRAPATEVFPIISTPAYRELAPDNMPAQALSNSHVLPDRGSGLKWTMTGSRPALEYRLARNQVLRLRGSRRGASITMRWDF